MSEDERRRGERIPINDEFASLEAQGPSGETWVSDLSLGGVFVHTDELLPVGSLIDLRFTILVEDPMVIEAAGKVVRHSHRPRGMGVQFTELEPAMRERIEGAMARRQPLDSGAPLRLPEPKPKPEPKPEPSELEAVEVDPDIDDDELTRVLFAQPAPVDGFALRRRTPSPSLDDAKTAAFPRVELDDDQTRQFRAIDDDDDDLTREYPALRRDDEPGA